MEQKEDNKTLDMFSEEGTDIKFWSCSNCGVVMFDYFDVGYDGPASEEAQNTCHPFMPWKVLCRSCHER